CVMFLSKVRIGIRHPDRVNDSRLTIRNDHVRKATLTDSKKLIEHTTIRKLTNLHWFQMLTPSFHSTFQISDIHDPCLFQNFHSPLRRNSFGTHDIDRLIFWQLLFQVFCFIFLMLEVNMHPLKLSALYCPFILILVLTNSLNDDTLVCVNLSSQFFYSYGL